MGRILLKKCWLLSILLFFNLGYSLNQYPLDSDYHRWDNLADTLLRYHQLNRLNSDIEIIGKSSSEELPIYAIHIHKNPLIKNKKKKIWQHQINSQVKKVLIIGQHHGEEPIGVEISLNIIKELTSNSKQDDFLANFYFVIIPTVNPEAFKIVNSGEYPLKRKNNKDTNLNGSFDLKVDGVDLNKNYPSNWDLADLNDPENQYYKGDSPASESETQAVISLAQKMNFDYAFFYHSSANGSYPEMIFFPYHWGMEKSSDWDAMKDLADNLASNLPCFYHDGNYHVFTGETRQYGYARDYFYRNFNTYSFTVEVSGISPNGLPLFLPNNRDLKLIVDRHTSALFKLLNKIM